MLMPLILFNIRHDFIMKQGFINMLTGAAVENVASFQQRFTKANNEMISLFSSITGFKNISLLGVTLFVVSLLINLRISDSRVRKFLIFTLIQTAIGYIGLIYAGRIDYSSQHYVHYLLPMVVIIISLALTELSKLKMGIISLGLIVIYLHMNLSTFINYKKNGSYYNKKKLAEYLYSLPSTDRIGIKFWSQEALAYDFVFF